MGRGGAERGRGEGLLRGREVLGCRGGRCGRSIAESLISDVLRWTLNTSYVPVWTFDAKVATDPKVACGLA